TASGLPASTRSVNTSTWTNGYRRMDRDSSRRSARVKGGADVADGGGSVGLDRHRDHVEPAARVVEAAGPQVVLGEADQPAALVPRHGVARTLAPVRPAALHLDEDDHAALATDQVDLALAEAHVALHHGQPRPGEPARRRVFRVLADRSPAVAHAL